MAWSPDLPPRRPACYGATSKHRAEHYVSWYYLGEISRCLGELDETFRYWNRAIDEHDPLALWIPTAIYPQLKSDPRYRALLARMNLA